MTHAEPGDVDDILDYWLDSFGEESDTEFQELRRKTYFEVMGIVSTDTDKKNYELQEFADEMLVNGYYGENVSVIPIESSGFTFSSPEESTFFRESEKMSAAEVAKLKGEIRKRLELLGLERKDREFRKNALRQAQERIPNLLQQLQLRSHSIGDFFTNCNYRVTFEKNILFSDGEVRRFVVFFNSDDNCFHVIIGEKKDYLVTFPETVEDARKLTLSDYMPMGVGMHADIYRDKSENFSRFGGGNLIVLSPTSLLIGGQSGDFGDFPEEIVRTALEQRGIDTIFLDNRRNITLSQVFDQIKRYKLDAGQ